MLISFYLNKNKLLSLLILICLLFSCRKEINFEESTENSNGAIDPNKPILGPWTELDLGDITLVKKIESDGQFIYFSGVQSGTRKMFKMDESGSISVLYTVNTYVSGGTGEVTHLSYQAPYLYACYSGFTSQTIKVFNSSGIQQQIDFDLNNNPSFQIFSLLDLDTSYCIVGNFSASATGVPSAQKIIFLNKTTGISTSTIGIVGVPVDIAVHSNQLFISGRALGGSGWTGNGYYGFPVAKHNGSSWTFTGPSNGTYYSNYESIPPNITGIKSLNNKLYCAGALNESAAIGVLNSNSYLEANFFWSLEDLWKNTIGKLKVYNDELYTYGSLTLRWSTIKTVHRLHNGTWQSIGALDAIPDDMTVLNGFAYAAVGGSIQKHAL